MGFAHDFAPVKPCEESLLVVLLQKALDFDANFCGEAQRSFFHSGKLFPIHSIHNKIDIGAQVAPIHHIQLVQLADHHVLALAHAAFRGQAAEILLEISLFGRFHLVSPRHTAASLHIDLDDLIVRRSKINVVCLAFQGKTVCKHLLAQQHLIPIGKQGLRDHLEELRNQQALHALPILGNDMKCVHLVTHLPRQSGCKRVVFRALHRLIVCVARLLGLSKHTVRFRGGFRRIFALSAPLQLCPDGFPVQSGKIFWFDDRKLLRYGRGFGRFHRFGKAVISVAETGAVQSTDDLLHCIVEIVGGSQHIGHIQGLCPVLHSIGQAQNTP